MHRRAGIALLATVLPMAASCDDSASRIPDAQRHHEEAARLRAKLATHPEAFTIHELELALGPATCARGGRTLNPSLVFEDAPGLLVDLRETDCTEGLEFKRLKPQFRCEDYARLRACNVRHLVENEVAELDATR